MRLKSGGPSMAVAFIEPNQEAGKPDMATLIWFEYGVMRCAEDVPVTVLEHAL